MTSASPRSVVVTGASTGIGHGIASVLIQAGFRVFGSVRRSEDAARLSSEFGPLFQPLLFDVTNEPSVRTAADAVGRVLGDDTLLGLVNNAGIAIGGPLLLQSTDDFRRQVDVNLIGALVVTKAFAPLLGADRARQGSPGRIIMISSVGGKIGAPFIGAYAASKHGLEGLSESLRRELQLFGIGVVIVGPGAVATPIWDKAQLADVSGYAGTPFEGPADKFTRFMVDEGRKGFPPERIGRVVLTALTTRRPRLRYAVVPNPLVNWVLPRLLPKRVIDRAIGRQLGLVAP